MLAGNVVSLLAPMVFIPVLTLVWRSPKYDWVSMKLIRRADDEDIADAANIDIELVPGQTSDHAEEEAEEQRKLHRASKVARSLTVILTLVFLVLWPMPLYGTGYIFSEKFFTGWVSVGILWLFCSAACVGVYPIWEGRHTSMRTFKSIYLDVTGKRKPVVRGRPTMAETVDAESKMEKGAETPPEKAVECDR